MPPFRIVTRHTDETHADRVYAQVGGLFDDLEDVEEFIQQATDADRTELQRINVALPIEERVRKRDFETLAELQDLGYEHKVQELVVKATGTDDGGNEVATEHRWKDVS